MLDSRVVLLSYFGNNSGMTPSENIESSRNDPVWRNSQSLARQLAQALAQPVDLKHRPRHRVCVGQTLVKTSDAVSNIFLASTK